MKRKPRKAITEAEETKPKIVLVESGSPDGPWTPIPASEIKTSVRSLADARLENPEINWLLAVDLRTSLYDSMLGCQTGLTSEQLEILRGKFGPNFTLDDVRRWFFLHGQRMDGFGWPAVLKLVQTEAPPTIEAKETDTGPENKESATLSWEAHAIALAWQHRDWTVEKIAKQVGKSARALYQNSDISGALKARSKQKRALSRLPSGEKNGETGNIEAY